MPCQNLTGSRLRVLAAGLIPLAVFGSILIGLIIWIFTSRKTFTRPYIAVIACDDASEEKVSSILKEKSNKCSIKSKTVRKGALELTYEIRLKTDDTTFINEIDSLDGVTSAVLVTYNGEYM